MKGVSGKMNYGPIRVRGVVLKCNSKELEPVIGYWNVGMGSREEFTTVSLRTTAFRKNRSSRKCTGAWIPCFRTAAFRRITCFFTQPDRPVRIGRSE